MDRLLIRDLVVRYKLEPSIRDVYVEGKLERDVLRWYLHAMGCSEVSVVSSAIVDLPAEVLAKHGLIPGEKTRLVALARELAASLGDEATQATCIVDVDCDEILGKRFECRLLVPTDYTCMEMYLADETTLGKFLQLVLGIEHGDGRELMIQYSPVLRELFLIRASLESLQVSAAWIDFTRYCKRSSVGLEFYRLEFVRNLLQSAAQAEKREALLAKVEQLRPRLKPNVRNGINGHDFLTLLTFDNRTIAARRGLRNQDAVATGLRGCLDLVALRKERMFQTIEMRVRRS